MKFFLLFILFYFSFVYSQCTEYDFKCCDIVNYSVYKPTAKTIDTTTCIVLQEIFNDNPSWDQECQNAFTDNYCLLAIPQCCSLSNPVVYNCCRTECIAMVDSCISNSTFGNSSIICSDSLWSDPPCNDGNGISCPSSEIQAYNNDNSNRIVNEINMKYTKEDNYEETIRTFLETLANNLLIEFGYNTIKIT